MAITRADLPKPSEVKALIIEPEDTLCQAFKKLIKTYAVAWKYHAYKYNPDGSLSEAFCSEIKTCIATANTTP